MFRRQIEYAGRDLLQAKKWTFNLHDDHIVSKYRSSIGLHLFLVVLLFISFIPGTARISTNERKTQSIRSKRETIP